MRGKLITFSGLDGAGKSTQIALLAAAYRKRGIEPKIFWSRVGYTPGFETLKSAARRILGRSGTLPPPGPSAERSRMLGRRGVRTAWRTIALLDLIFSYGVLVRWWRFCGRTVICDRYLWDSLVDLEINHAEAPARGFGLWRLLEAVSVRPDHAYCFLIPVEESLRRSDLKGEPFRDSALTLARRLERYRTLRRRAAWVEVDGTSTRESTEESIAARCMAPPA